MLEHELSKTNQLVICLDDPASNNALGVDAAEKIVELLYKCKPRSLLMTARGRVFCAGGQLKTYAGLTSKKQGLEMNDRIRKCLQILNEVAIPKAVVVNGLCLGGGVELISCFDFIVASPVAYLGLWQRKIGLSFGWGGKERLAARLGRQQLQSWYISGELVTSYRARDMGLVEVVASSGTAVAKAMAWLAGANEMSIHALEVYKQPGLTESQIFENLWLSPDHQQALKLFSGGHQ